MRSYCRLQYLLFQKRIPQKDRCLMLCSALLCSALLCSALLCSQIILSHHILCNPFCVNLVILSFCPFVVFYKTSYEILLDFVIFFKGFFRNPKIFFDFACFFETYMNFIVLYRKLLSIIFYKEHRLNRHDLIILFLLHLHICIQCL